jgi:hypothetical protein
MSRCATCDEDAELYMLQDAIWRRIGDREELCLSCAALRLGRPLSPDDFLFTPLEMAVRLALMTSDSFEDWSLVLGEETTNHALFDSLATSLTAADGPDSIKGALADFCRELRAEAERRRRPAKARPELPPLPSGPPGRWSGAAGRGGVRQPSLFLEFRDDAFRRVHRHVAVVLLLAVARSAPFVEFPSAVRVR